MQKLSREDILFIDAYLKNSDVMYVDIRIEMIDHVASEIEQRINEGDTRDFYYIFKDFMVENKASLLANNKQFLKQTRKKVFKQVLVNTFSSQGLLLYIFSCFCLVIIYNYMDIKVYSLFVHFSPFVLLGGLGFVYFLFVYNKRHERYSALEQLGFGFLLIYHVINMFLNPFVKQYHFIEQYIVMSVGLVSLILVLIIMIFVTGFQFKKEYEQKFKTIC